MNTALNQVYYVEIKKRLLDGNLIVINPPETGQKKRIEQIHAAVKLDHVYPQLVKQVV
ncbi:MAG: hypothetical protein QW579_03685 [Desulfurococcaceae archaeon]